MPSQIKVDEIKNVAGQYKIKTNVLEGQTTADSIDIAVLVFVLSLIVVTSKFVAFIIPLITYPIAVIVSNGL